MDKTLIIVNGFPRSGKDTFMDYYADLWRETGLVCHKHSTIDTVKTIAKTMGWDGTKDARNRCMLSELKDLYTEYFDGPLNEIKKLLEQGWLVRRLPALPDYYQEVDMLFVAMREPAEIEKTFKWATEAGINCQTVLIRGKNEERDHGSHSDANVLLYNYGLTINNYGSIEEFHQKIQNLFEYLIK